MLRNSVSSDITWISCYFLQRRENSKSSEVDLCYFTANYVLSIWYFFYTAATISVRILQNAVWFRANITRTCWNCRKIVPLANSSNWYVGRLLIHYGSGNTNMYVCLNVLMNFLWKTPCKNPYLQKKKKLYIIIIFTNMCGSSSADIDIDLHNKRASLLTQQKLILNMVVLSRHRSLPHSLEFP